MDWLDTTRRQDAAVSNLTDRLGQIKAVSFDGDMTLWDFDQVMRHALSITLKELQKQRTGSAAAGLTVEQMMAIRDGVEQDWPEPVVNLERVRFEAFVRTVQAVGADDRELAADLNTLYIRHRYEDLELYADVLPTLGALEGRYRLGMISNGNGYPERCGLAGRFAFVALAQEVGVAKPDRGLFEAACRQAECDPCELMHVGDSLATDVQGANVVGAVSVWLNRDGGAGDADVEPDFEIGALTELEGVLGGRGTGTRGSASRR